jgi:hypothetical protein
MIAVPVSPREARTHPRILRRQLGFDVAKALVVKVLVILVISMVFFGASNRPHVDPAALFAPVTPSPQDSK